MCSSMRSTAAGGGSTRVQRWYWRSDVNAVATGAPCPWLDLRPALTEDAEPTAGLLERKQLAVADAEQRAAEHADERHAVLRIAQRTQQQRERLDLARLGERAGAADFHRDLQRLERLHVRKQASASSGEDEEVAVGTTPGVDLGPDEPGDALASAVATSLLSTSSAIVSVYAPDTARRPPVTFPASASLRTVPTRSPGAGCNGAYCGECGVTAAGNCDLNTRLAHAHSAAVDRKLVVSGTTAPLADCSIRARTRL